ncbi:hypothetical protein Bca52824_039926 [Brassica carinata]|uniref:Uncharacterized protein n=1 Tax=Brassica carinata TaxID=52824 RepID=A0A8X7RSJ8_BRACI|nr:hypothetical protein Bca52824_039926 [Brassica carinata]
MGDLLNGTETELKSWDFRGGYLRLTVVASSTRSRGAEAITNSGDIVEKVGLIDVLMGGVGGVEKLGRDNNMGSQMLIRAINKRIWMIELFGILSDIDSLAFSSSSSFTFCRFDFIS